MTESTNSSLKKKSAFDYDDPKYRLCGLNVIQVARMVAFIEIIFATFMCVALTGGVAATIESKITVKLVAVFTTLLVAAKITVSCFLLFGLTHNRNSWLTPFLVLKGLEILLSPVGMAIAILGLMGRPGFVMDFKPKRDPNADVFGRIRGEDAFAEVHAMSPNGMSGIVFALMFFMFTIGIYFWLNVFRCRRVFLDREDFEETTGRVKTDKKDASPRVKYAPVWSAAELSANNATPATDVPAIKLP